MKHLLFIYTLVFLLLLGKTSLANEDSVDFDSLIPAEQAAAELGQNETVQQDSESTASRSTLKTEPNGEEEQAFLFHHHYPWVYPYPAPYYYPVYYPYYYPTPYRAPVVTCFASDAFGATWSATSYNAYEAQNLAFNQCLSFSNRGCYSRGCNYQ